MNPIGKLLGKGRRTRKRSKLGGYLAITPAEHAVTPTRVDEAINLTPDETLEEFCGALCAALEAYAQLEEDEMLHIVQIGDGWLVACVCSGAGTPEHEDTHVRVAWNGSSDGGFEFANPQLVAPKMTYEPMRPEPESPMDLDAKKPTRRVKRQASALVQQAQVEADPPAVVIEQTATEPTRFDDLVLLEDVRLTEARELRSPSGKPFLAVLEGYGAVSGVVNENGRLYADERMGEEATRIGQKIAEAFAQKRAAPGGEVDHPSAEPTMRGLGTMLIGLAMENNRARIKLGVLDTNAGRDLLALHEYKFPIGVSTVSYGSAELRTMDESDPYYARNGAKNGSAYYFIRDFRIEQFDAVRHPSANVFLDEHADAPPAIREAAARLCADGSEPDANGTCPCRITETATMETKQEAETMNEDQLREALAKLGVEPDKIAAFASTLAEQGEKINKLEATTAQMRESLDSANATIEAQRAAVAALTTERDAAKFAADVREAVDAAVTGKLFTEARRTFVLKLAESFDASKPVTEQVATAAARFEAEVLPTLAPAEPVNERKVNEAQKKQESADGHGVVYASDPIPFGYSAAASR